jgi:hypothetical protein
MRLLLRAGLIVAAIVAAFAVTAATALAQNTVMAPSNTSRSGVQSVITQTRDSLQRQILAGEQQPQHHRSTTKKRVVHSSDH